MKVCVLVTRLRPALDGVGDYALSLARQMREDFNIDSHFIVCDPSWKGENLIDGFQITQIASRSSEDLEDLLAKYVGKDSTVLLHYVPHGYAKKACPFWLIQALSEWRSLSERNHLLTMFHELYATLTLPWDTDFWLWPIQRNLYIKLAKLSDSCITSCANYGQRIDYIRPEEQPASLVLPVPSNCGEPKTVSAFNLRKPIAVIFGQAGSKSKVYQHIEQAAEGLTQLGVKEILDIGPFSDIYSSEVGGIPIYRLGKQSEQEISKVLHSSLLGLIHYQPQRMPKSGIFAGYSAHGLPCLNLSHERQSIADGLLEAHHYITPKQLSQTSLSNLQSIAEHSYSWYQGHNLSRQAQAFAEKLLVNIP